MLTTIYHSFILVVRSYPYPDIILAIRYSQSPIARANPGRPELSDLFEMEGRMPRVFTKELKAPVGRFPDLHRVRPVTFPKAARCAMDHRFLKSPCFFPSMASLTRKSSLPESESAWICLSHCAQSRFKNHSRNWRYSSTGNEATVFSISSILVIDFPPCLKVQLCVPPTWVIPGKRAPFPADPEHGSNRCFLVPWVAPLPFDYI